MQTNFTAEQLRDPDIAVSNQVLRTCVHCGFCTATCPTFLLLGDELDSPRGRIYLIKDMLETGRPATEEVVRHVDRCLSCLSCMTTCPSGVHYMHLVDHARHLHRDAPIAAPGTSGCCARCWPRCCRVRRCSALALVAAPAGAAVRRPASPAQPAGASACARCWRWRRRDCRRRARSDGARRASAPRATRRARVALLAGCAQQVLAPAINEATIRLLTRLGVEVVVAEGAGCCGALTHHMGQHDPAMASGARQHRRPGAREIDGDGLDADRHQRLGLRHHGEGLRLHVPRRTEPLARAGGTVSALALDISEFLDPHRLRADARSRRG